MNECNEKIMTPEEYRQWAVSSIVIGKFFQSSNWWHGAYHSSKTRYRWVKENIVSMYNAYICIKSRTIKRNYRPVVVMNWNYLALLFVLKSYMCVLLLSSGYCSSPINNLPIICIKCVLLIHYLYCHFKLRVIENCWVVF